MPAVYRSPRIKTSYSMIADGYPIKPFSMLSDHSSHPNTPGVPCNKPALLFMRSSGGGRGVEIAELSEIFIE